ncbi:MAG TPA: hypothetical protein VMR21_03190 [Vicinamibacteria bacterium]|nr:hypothetical protein [Vicinamibacteria bacterium]
MDIRRRLGPAFTVVLALLVRAQVDHAAMGHAMAVPSPEPKSVAAAPGQPAATLQADGLDTPPTIAVEEARRAAALSEHMDHGMSHGTYRHLDAGRPGVPATSPRGEAHTHHGHTPPSPAPSPSPEAPR